ncbi:hypothetical protein M5K25_009572 [Dendrobium thyrsiflorum]|uniref:Uncharacterized protein n=1 Tax=Dendrobium thyrsiflorum TaxID=117978 RepID=A0ABD0V6L1_DENTH
MKLTRKKKALYKKLSSAFRYAACNYALFSSSVWVHIDLLANEDKIFICTPEGLVVAYCSPRAFSSFVSFIFYHSYSPSRFSLTHPYSLSPTADQANLSKLPAAPTLPPILSRRTCMGDPDVDHGFVFDDQGRTDILASPFFDVHFGNDETTDDYVDRILYQLTLSLEEHIPPGRWYIVNNPSNSPNSTTSPATTILRAACLLVAH